MQFTEKRLETDIKVNQSMDFIDITEEKLNINDAIKKVSIPSTGAVSTFSGTTRNEFQGKRVLKLEYEGYIPMAKIKMLDICSEIRKKWPDVAGIAMSHRLGIIEVNESSIIIAISSPHRKDSLQATEYAIDQVKALVPIWKREWYEGDNYMWKENVEWNSNLRILPCIADSN